MSLVSADFMCSKPFTGDFTMKMLKIGLAAACAIAATSAGATVSNAQAGGGSANTSHCHYEFTVLMPDGVYDVYSCHYIGDGWY